MPNAGSASHCLDVHDRRSVPAGDCNSQVVEWCGWKMKHPEWREYFAGGLAATANVLITYPLSKIMFRQMINEFPVGAALRQLKKEGFLHLYRGPWMPLGQKCATSSLMFGSYAQYSRMLSETALSRVFITMCAAFMAGCTEAVLTPFERVQVVMQDSSHHQRFRNTAQALMSLARSHGLSEYYRGATAVLMRNGLANVIFFMVKDQVRLRQEAHKLPDADQEATESRGWTGKKLLIDFATGACTGAFISTLFFPVNVTKTHMQLVIGGPFMSFIDVFTDLLRKRGIRGMFKGVHVNYTRSFVSWGVTNLLYELILHYFKPYT